MTTPNEYNACGEDLERILQLKTSPIAVKMLEKEEDIPEGAIRPKRDRGYHIAQCQAFAMSRRDRLSIAMLKEDNWCFAPLIAYGLVDKPDDPDIVAEHLVSFPRLEKAKYIGIVSAPLKTANFEPDLALIYSDSAQLRNMLMPSHWMGKEAAVTCHFYPPSCAYTVVPVLLEGQLVVALPDPGDYERALARADEIILSVPKRKIKALVAGVRILYERGEAYTFSTLMMQTDFSRPDFYKKLFKNWGLDVEV